MLCIVFLQGVCVKATVLSTRNTEDAGLARLSEYTHRLWQAKDGLADQSVQAFAQTPDGSLWIGTKGGLLRFDGDRFQGEDESGTPASLQRGVNCLLAAQDGSLWIGTEGAGLFHYKNGYFTQTPTESSSVGVPRVVRSLLEEENGRIWVGSDQGLFLVSQNHLIHLDGTDKVPSIFVRAIASDGHGNVWVGGTKLLRFYNGHFMREYALSQSSSLNLVTSLSVNPNGDLWVGMLSGLYRWSSVLQSIEPASEIRAEISLLRQTSDGRLWIGTVGQGLYVKQDKHLVHVVPDILPSETLNAAMQDREGNLWLGTRAGLLRLSKTPVRIIDAPGGADAEFETITADTDGTIWVAAQTHLFHVQQGRALPWNFPGLLGLRVRTLFRDRQAKLWIGTDGSGLVCLDGRKRRHFISGHGLINDFVRSIVQSHDGSMWIGTDGGLTHITEEGSQNYSVSDGLSYFSVTSLFEDRSGDLWAGTSRGLTRIVQGHVRSNLVTQALQQEQIWSIAQDKSGDLWFGTSRGLYGWNGKSLIHLTSKNGLATDIVYSIVLDADGNAWLSGPTSVSRVSVQQLDLYARGGVDSVRLNEYLGAFDLNSAELYSGMQPSGTIAPDGSVWFPSNRGAINVNAGLPVHTGKLQIVIDQLSANGRRLPVGPEVILSPNEDRLDISYMAIRLRSQQGLRYRYRMEGLESWTDAGVRRTVNYARLPSGKFKFRVQAYSVDDPIQVVETSITIVRRPHFYATPWFLFLSVVGAACLVLLLYRLRMRQVKLRFRAITEERERLAREMHDTLIQGCVGVSTLLEAALGVEASEDSLRQELMRFANHQAQVTVEAAREAVWGLRHHFDVQAIDAGSLCRELVRELNAQGGTSITCEVVEPCPVLSESDAHELLMIVREALTNALAHADASAITVSVRCNRDEIKVQVLDDGRGFDLNHIRANEKHFGLVGMGERAKLLGARFTISSTPGSGTALTVVLLSKRRSSGRRTDVNSGKLY